MLPVRSLVAPLVLAMTRAISVALRLTAAATFVAVAVGDVL